MEFWYIYLKCYEMTGYFTGFAVKDNQQEVCVHPYKSRAKKFNTKESAEAMAKYLKARFKCVISCTVLK